MADPVVGNAIKLTQHAVQQMVDQAESGRIQRIHVVRKPGDCRFQGVTTRRMYSGTTSSGTKRPSHFRSASSGCKIMAASGKSPGLNAAEHVIGQD